MLRLVDIVCLRIVLFDFLSQTSLTKSGFVDDSLGVMYEPMLKTSSAT